MTGNLTVVFKDWEDGVRPLLIWRESTNWVPKDEQVWIRGVRYTVVRVEHQDEIHKLCVVRRIQ